ncbi:MAG: 16S rRNA (adenine(1518)-N(6)/adenine(1519)-N(6))-dimethyltransferase RsmA [Candidatus Bathyarchaeota archaeon]|nr:16S rRNA (adenine(1518)-N(6)/adenine(1519)-N(6))-dimethyltransferase RsmA [Candidatus Bathyarchaeota archaeon]
MSLLEETKKILRAYGIRPRKRLGQNFLVDGEILDKMISYASVCRDDVVLEIGAGLGFLTERLADVSGRVIAVEVDPKLFKILSHRLRNRKNVDVLMEDILRIKTLAFDKVVSVPPYSISSPLLFWLLKRDFRCAVLTFQEEFSRRLAAPPGTEDYGRLSVAVYYHSDVELLDRIPKELFWPTPKVNSTIVRLKPRKPPFHVDEEEEFFSFIRAVFTQRNKKLKNAVAVFLSGSTFSREDLICLANTIPFCGRRVRELAPEELALAFSYLRRELGSMKR